MGKRLTEHLDYLSFIRVLLEFCDGVSCDWKSAHNTQTFYTSHLDDVEDLSWLLCGCYVRRAHEQL